MHEDGAIDWTGYVPASHAAPHVEWIWSARGRAGDLPTHRVLPDACADVIVVGDGAAFVVGPLRAARVVDLPANGALTAGMRLRPGAARMVLGVPVGELLDGRVPLADVAPALARRFELARERAACGGAASHAATRALEEAIALHVGGSAPDPQIAALVATLWRDGGQRVPQLARSVGLSERQLRRRCGELCGHAPAELARVMRLRRLLRLAAARPHDGLASLAAAAGWHDQQHMTRDVRRLTGLTPTRLLRRDGRSVQDRRAAGA
ncbi:helix-turn-helix domain-containing protein [Conexibacter woesei]|uniref:Helix-turn-helix, AraC domain protein n=1 Tax=Conexibacter woesei (strain DSM 14684 / CCUG 47730 / CIP 108061 / JCM 11494 / NBRC 100937 / ID131577) TaxID=469383 RepID=D3F874_CONWI|nr:helix-turn-helix domain-containing protein [Conexibacter woesei]ADB48944.1 Helix-turn-helix, AraC domain protein [Conexibacter woesei DSM 14684]